MEQGSTYQNDNLYFSFDFVETDGQLALGLQVNDACGAEIVRQAYPFDNHSTAASWLLYWHLLEAAGRKVASGTIQNLKKDFNSQQNVNFPG